MTSVANLLDISIRHKLSVGFVPRLTESEAVEVLKKVSSEIEGDPTPEQFNTVSDCVATIALKRDFDFLGFHYSVQTQEKPTRHREFTFVCGRCAQKHTKLRAKKFSRNATIFNYWSVCPVTKEPVLFSLQERGELLVEDSQLQFTQALGELSKLQVYQAVLQKLLDCNPDEVLGDLLNGDFRLTKVDSGDRLLLPDPNSDQE